ncbi:MCE family protein [Streptacidiphilus sp. PB12-B1b]|uniref:MCE family protein n=1 Tax=Streptacidiphilus sp. PB12-B1b TaxID=2705012 RepID=UPI0015F826B7|nr:MCE family protein [Streptacidiphilus sp. PB12-B1b]QMU77730.1 MCE family protein [Streptacidiphilus sp. PB12-B1b]
MSARPVSALRRRGAGLCFLLVPVLLAWLSVSVYDHDFSDTDSVRVRTDSVGNQMQVNADVKLRGVVVGRVSAIRANGSGATLTLAIAPGELRQIPADVSAQMLPTTLFGARYVALVVPSATPYGATADAALTPGSTIPEDRSGDAVELEQVFSNLLPLLDDVQPAQLSATLNAVASALQGRGAELGTTLASLDAYLRQINPQLPALNADLHNLVKVSQSYADAAPDLLQALTELTVTSGTVANQQSQLAGLYATTTAAAGTTTAFLKQNQSTIIRLAADSRGTLTLLGRYSSEFPCTLRTLAAFVPVMDKALGKGTDEPGLHVDLTTAPSRGAYLPGTDTPVYDKAGGPACYSTPYTGQPNTPQENALINELLAPQLDTTAGSLPSWSSLLVGPVLRGTEVGVK